jgi:hypothetical protein
METQTQVPDALKDIKTSFSATTVRSNLVTALQEIKIIAHQKEYVVEGSIDRIISDIDLGDATLTSRKKLAKKIYYFMRKKNMKTISSLFSFIRKRFLGDQYRVTIKPSLLEQEIISLRENYKAMCLATETTRLALKEKKRMFYEKNMKHDN